MNKLTVLVFLGLIVSICCIGRPCGGEVKELILNGCKEEPCLIKRGSKGIIGIDFKARSDSKTLTGKTTIKMMEHDLPFPDYHENACIDSNIKCPYTKSTSLSYRYNFKIHETYQHMQTHATIKLVNDKNETEACFEFDFKVVD